ncbi:hypothetical protein [Lactobacillus terrae]|uniref:hypothetical protein n=1 Tax=Lactobacillus terrae TaxID=2269374 RepID=UPI000C1B7586|nr:hypothetical protein [Lactobacillus terrae]
MIDFLKTLNASDWIAGISFLLSLLLAVDKLFSYRARTQIQKIEFVYPHNANFYIHLYITNKSSRTIGIYDMKIKDTRLIKHSHDFKPSNSLPYGNIQTSMFPININPWEQREILAEFVYETKDENEHIVGPSQGDKITIKIQTNRGIVSKETVLPMIPKEQGKALEEW